MGACICIAPPPWAGVAAEDGADTGEDLQRPSGTANAAQSSPIAPLMVASGYARRCLVVLGPERAAAVTSNAPAAGILVSDLD